MNKNDLIAALYDAKVELNTLASYLEDPATPWPNYGLKATAQAHKRLRDRIDALLMQDESEDIPLRQENFALRAALRSQTSSDEWRLRYLETRAEVARLKESVANLDALYVSCTDALRESEAENARLREAAKHSFTLDQITETMLKAIDECSSNSTPMPRRQRTLPKHPPICPLCQCNAVYISPVSFDSLPEQRPMECLKCKHKWTGFLESDGG